MTTRIDSLPSGAADFFSPTEGAEASATGTVASPTSAASKAASHADLSQSNQVESFSPNASVDDSSMAAWLREGPTFSAAMLMMSAAPKSGGQSIDPSLSGQSPSAVTAPGASAPASQSKAPTTESKKKEAPAKTAPSSSEGAALKSEVKSSKGPSITKQQITTETIPEKAPAGFKAVKLDVPWYSQFENHGDVTGGQTQCNSMTKQMMKDGKNTAIPGGREPEWNFNIADSKDVFGRIQPNAARAKEGRAYIDAQLDAGHPVMVGVMWRTPAFNKFNDGNADHYVAITGRGVAADGSAYYSFNDAGATTAAKGADTREQNRLFVDANTGMLFRPGLQLTPDKMWPYDARYEVSQVRKNQ